MVLPLFLMFDVDLVVNMLEYADAASSAAQFDRLLLYMFLFHYAIELW